jgi:hypothetical protein
MDHTPSSDKPIVFLACNVFQHWLEELLPEEWKTRVSFYEYGLHAVPKNLRQTLQEAIDAIEQPSLIVLVYGLCGNGLDKISTGKHTLLIPRTDDCIAILLGSYQAYRQEAEQEPGTYYLSKGWLEAGSNPLAESQKYEQKYGAETAAYLMDTQYQRYRRLAMVARNEEELADYRAQAKAVADYCARWGMRYEELPGSDGYLRRLVEIAAGQTEPGEDFLLIGPGGKLAQELFMRCE